MRSARMLMATAAASAVLALGAPGAYAAGDDWDHTDSSYGKEHDKGKDEKKEYGSEHGKKEYGSEHGEKGHDAPRGGVHAGGGALSSVTEDSWSGKQDGGYPTGQPDATSGTAGQSKGSGTAKQDENSWSGKQDGGSWSGKQDKESWGGGHEKPSGGVHTGGGGLASPAVTAGGLAVLAVAATGLYAARRKKTAGSVA
ncbi:hypothetical protein [Streptomyces sp. NBC_00391]|uniref:hypothetical protein n=1 Tax=Streptomyces sp. NBC_00391 TaxID=2903647 RepID=UPI002E1D676A